MWLYHFSLQNCCEHARCNYCSKFFKCMDSFDNHIKAWWLSCFAAFKDLIFKCKPHQDIVISIKWDVFTNLSWKCSKRKYSRTSARGLFSFNCMQTRLNIFFMCQPTEEGYREDDLAFWEDHLYFLLPAICWVFPKFSLWPLECTFSCLLIVTSVLQLVTYSMLSFILFLQSGSV